ncbi:hypothetical protein [Chitinophaga sp. sic0106]|uniref:hypothetical protein n=1 Tax=Chitinophaga sp. sic0106 TaxID=2854785 RepID=UPI001C44E361|nr:hypothetical protein [Chitinophaga sp. sic0106]MBV7533954.1 hypothetical protein [Chitinophaga sp. sic0106]
MKVFGFSPSIKEQGFVKKEKGSICLYQFLVYDRTFIKTGAKGVLVEPYIWIGVDEIEKHYKKITLNTELKKETDFITIGNSVASILHNPDGLYKKRNESLNLLITEDSQVEAIASELLNQFKKVALPYCELNSSVARVDELLNFMPNEYKVNAANDIFRITKGVIAAKLNNNPSLNVLIDIYDQQLIERDMDELHKQEMERLKRLLPNVILATS